MLQKYLDLQYIACSFLCMLCLFAVVADVKDIASSSGSG